MMARTIINDPTPDNDKRKSCANSSATAATISASACFTYRISALGKQRARAEANARLIDGRSDAAAQQRNGTPWGWW